MKRRLLVVLYVLVVLLVPVAVSQVRQLDTPTTSNPTAFRGDSPTIITPQDYWYLVRSPVDANDPNMTANTKTWGGCSLGHFRPWNTVTVAFLCYGDADPNTITNPEDPNSTIDDPNAIEDPNGGSFDYEVYACRPYSSLEKVCSGHAAVGELKASALPHAPATIVSDPNEYKWVDGSSLLVSSQFWDTAVGYTKVSDEMGKISWDPLGAPYVYVRIYALDKVSLVYVLCTGR